MPKRIKHRHPKDVNQAAYHLVEMSTGETEPQTPAASQSISEYMAAIGRKGGKIGGKRRLTTLTAKERKEIARNAAKARWKKSSSSLS
jgi:hypothetical protein